MPFLLNVPVLYSTHHEAAAPEEGAAEVAPMGGRHGLGAACRVPGARGVQVPPAGRCESSRPRERVCPPGAGGRPPSFRSHTRWRELMGEGASLPALCYKPLMPLMMTDRPIRCSGEAIRYLLRRRASTVSWRLRQGCDGQMDARNELRRACRSAAQLSSDSVHARFRFL